MHLHKVQPKRVRHDADRRKAHRCRAVHRVQRQAQPDVAARRKRDADGVIEERPEQILVDVAYDMPRQIHRRRNIRKVALDQHDVRRVERDIGARADRDADVRTRQRRRVVDAVADHRGAPLLLQHANDRLLVGGQDLRRDALRLDADRRGDAGRGESVVASTDFTAEEGAGEADVRFVFDAQELEGDVVVFEEVYDMKTGVKITEHKDINYKGQTVTLIKKTVPHIPSIPSIPGVPSVPEITETLTSTLPVPETGEGMSFVRNIGITILATGAIVFISLGIEGIKEKKKR